MSTPWFEPITVRLKRHGVIQNKTKWASWITLLATINLCLQGPVLFLITFSFLNCMKNYLMLYCQSEKYCILLVHSPVQALVEDCFYVNKLHYICHLCLLISMKFEYKVTYGFILVDWNSHHMGWIKCTFITIWTLIEIHVLLSFQLWAVQLRYLLKDS